MHVSESISFIILVTLVIFATLDLNEARKGLIRVSQQPLETVIESMAK